MSDASQHSTGTESMHNQQEFDHYFSESDKRVLVTLSEEMGSGTLRDLTGYSRSTVNGSLSELRDAGYADRRKVGNGYTNWRTAAGDEAAAQLEASETELTKTVPAPTSNEGDNGAPVNRNYDWDAMVPTDASDYRATNGELARIQGLINTRATTGLLPRFLVGGPTGAGKTTLATYIARELDAPLFTIQAMYDMSGADLLGAPELGEDGTTWIDGPLTKALLASQERETVLLVDEVNRARPHAKGVLFSALDHRATVQLDGPRGGEVIEGTPENLIVFATMNEGREYNGTMEMDAAEKSRFSARFDVDYLGRKNPSSEMQLLEDRAGVDDYLAEDLVLWANDIRNAAEETNSQMTGAPGISTRALIACAQTAMAYDASGIENPILGAVDDAVISTAYSGQPAQYVNTLAADRFDGAPVDGYGAWVDGEQENYTSKFSCASCSDVFDSSDLSDENEIGLNCPTCDGQLVQQ